MGHREQPGRGRPAGCVGSMDAIWGRGGGGAWEAAAGPADRQRHGRARRVQSPLSPPGSTGSPLAQPQAPSCPFQRPVALQQVLGRREPAGRARRWGSCFLPAPTTCSGSTLPLAHALRRGGPCPGAGAAQPVPARPSRLWPSCRPLGSTWVLVDACLGRCLQPDTRPGRCSGLRRSSGPRTSCRSSGGFYFLVAPLRFSPAHRTHVAAVPEAPCHAVLDEGKGSPSCVHGGLSPRAQDTG